MNDFTCPRCGGHTWGSSYNFDGPGDTKPDSDGFTGASSKHYEGTFMRMCHGYIENRACRYNWNSSDDLKHGLKSVPGSSSVGTLR